MVLKKELVKENQELSQKLNNVTAHRDMLKGKCEKLEKIILEEESINKSLESQITDLRTENSTLRDEVNKLFEKIKKEGLVIEELLQSATKTRKDLHASYAETGNLREAIINQAKRF